MFALRFCEFVLFARMKCSVETRRKFWWKLAECLCGRRIYRSRNSSLELGNVQPRSKPLRRLPEEIVQPPACNGSSTSIDDNGCVDVIDGRNAAAARTGNCLRK